MHLRIIILCDRKLYSLEKIRRLGGQKDLLTKILNQNFTLCEWTGEVGCDTDITFDQKALQSGMSSGGQEIRRIS